MMTTIDRLEDRVNAIQEHGCALARIHPDHEARLRRVEEIAIALGEKPADHETRIRNMERLIDKGIGAAGAIGVVGGIAGGVVSMLISALLGG